jgi:heme/copper-type cytochrome/quinol oxidase subunit 2
LIRLAILVAATSFAVGGSLSTLAILLDRAAEEGAGKRLASPSGGNAAAKSGTASEVDGGESLPGWSPGSASFELLLTGVNYHWEVRYPELAGTAVPSSQQGSAGSRKIHLPANTHVRIRLQSRDYVYLLKVPDAGDGAGNKSQIAVPNLPFHLDFRTGPRGTILLTGDHLCGWPRPSLDLTAVVQSPQDFRAWMIEQRK